MQPKLVFCSFLQKCQRATSQIFHRSPEIVAPLSTRKRASRQYRRKNATSTASYTTVNILLRFRKFALEVKTAAGDLTKQNATETEGAHCTVQWEERAAFWRHSSKERATFPSRGFTLCSLVAPSGGVSNKLRALDVLETSSGLHR